jgi:hypothetical protein
VRVEHAVLGVVQDGAPDHASAPQDNQVQRRGQGGEVRHDVARDVLGHLHVEGHGVTLRGQGGQLSHHLGGDVMAGDADEELFSLCRQIGREGGREDKLRWQNK